MGAKIFVTGATGNVGAEVVKALLARGIEVRAGDIDPTRIQSRFGDTVEAVRFNFGEEATYTDSFKGIEKVFLMRPPQITDIKKLITPAIDAAIAAGVNHFVFLSLIGIENNKIVPHYKVEQHLLTVDVGFTFLRCSFFMQNLNTVHRTEIRDRDEIFLPAGKSQTSFLDVRDIGAVAALTLTEDGKHARKMYDLTGPVSLDYYQVAELFSEVLGRKITYRNPSTMTYFIRQLRNGVKLSYALVTTWLYSNTRNGMAQVVTPEVERLLGRKPINLRQYIEDYKDSVLVSSRLHFNNIVT